MQHISSAGPPPDELTPLQALPTVEYSVVIPLYNDAAILPQLHRRLSAVLASFGETYEIIYVDDGSEDGTFMVLRGIHESDPGHVKGVGLLRNFGQHPALTAGFEQSAGRVVITMDSDLQNPPEELPKLLERFREGHDVVVGWRQIRNDPILRTVASRLINWVISRCTGVKLRDYGSMFRVHRREVIRLLNRTEESAKFLTALTSWLGVTILEVPVRHEPAADGRSRYRLRSLFRMAIDLVTSYSLVPIQVVTAAGLIMALVGIAAGLFLLAWRIFLGGNVTGLSSFVALLLVLFGIQLAGLGVVGEYIGRIYTDVRRRPYYLVRTILRRGS